MSSILGAVSVASIGFAVHLAYLNKGTAQMQYGAAVLLSILYAAAGLALGVRSLMEKDIFRFFPVLGIALNVLGIAAGVFILYLGTVI